jgi:hypothetical protein
MTEQGSHARKSVDEVSVQSQDLTQKEWSELNAQRNDHQKLEGHIRQQNRAHTVRRGLVLVWRLCHGKAENEGNLRVAPYVSLF